MRTSLSFFLILSFFSSNLSGQNLSQHQIREDFDYLNNALEEGHPGLYWFSSKQDLNKTVKNVEASLDGVTNVKELQALLTDINNAISCGHTAILLPEAHYKKVDSLNLFLPFNIVLVEDKVLVAESFSDNLLRGDQIISINEEPIDNVISQLQKFIPIDKGIETKRARSIEIIFPYYYAVYKGSPAKFEIEIKKQAKGKQLKKEVKAVGMQKKMYKSVRGFAPAQFPIELSIDDSRQTAVLKLATFSRQLFKAHEINFQDTIKGIFDYLEVNNVENLIIDLRWNNGGTMTLAEYLFSFFIDSTHRYYNDAEIKQPIMEGVSKYGRSRNMKLMMEKQFGVLEPKDDIYYLPGEKFLVDPTKPQFEGDLYLLTNGFSFSATSAFIALIQENELGLVVGETPGGAFDAVNAGPPMFIELPNSKIRLYYRIIGTRYNVGGNKVSTKVDVKIDNTLESFINGIDVQMEYVLEMIK
ncbi:MAG: hypothetical protein DRI71_09045 [Bacteroidetes bacterium]|nr:MAG: hypothetical protein DRI71_09045 [Bacteroidota bacterium]